MKNNLLKVVRLFNDPIITTSWDDGDPLDLKLAEMLAKYHIPGTFYLPIDNIERKSLNSRDINAIAQYFDIGGHTYHHIDLTRVSPKEAQREILDGKKQLEQIIGKEIVSFCYPMGRYNHEIIKIVKKCGYKGARTIHLNTRNIANPFKAGTTVNTTDYFFTRYLLHVIMATDFRMFDFIFRNNLYLKSWDYIAKSTLEFIMKNGGIWHLWGHSWEISDHNDWNRLISIFKMIESLPAEVLRLNNSQLFLNCSRDNKNSGM